MESNACWYYKVVSQETWLNWTQMLLLESEHVLLKKHQKKVWIKTSNENMNGKIVFEFFSAILITYKCFKISKQISETILKFMICC